MGNLKRIFTLTLVIFAGLMLVLLSGCNPKGGNGGDNPAVNADVPTPIAPLATTCLQAPAATTWWNQYDVRPYPFQNGYSSNGPESHFSRGFCGCQQGTMPTCTQQGLVCIPVQHLNYNVVTWGWSTNKFNPGWRYHNPHRQHRSRGGDRWRQTSKAHTAWEENDSELETDSEELAEDFGNQKLHRFAYYLPPQPQPQSRPQQPQAGSCGSSVAQTCTPNAGIQARPGMIYCQPLQTGNWQGPGVWVQL